MVTGKVTVTNKNGIHLRLAGELVKAASQFASSVLVSREDEEIDAKSILGVAGLGAEYGSELTFRVEGEDEEKALAFLVDLIKNNFSQGEDS